LTGTLELGAIGPQLLYQLSVNPILFGVALLCVLVGISFKISAVPFHFWCPDAFEGAKIEVTTWLSVVSKGAGLVLLLRVVQVFCGSIDVAQNMRLLSPMAWTIGILATITCTWANFVAYKQTNLKRLLAYSSIAHAGYMLMAAAVFLHPSMLIVDPFLPALPNPAASALLLYVLIYLFMNLGAFGVVALVGWSTGSDDLDAFTGLFRRAWWLALPMLICLMSLIGLPIFAGFFGKWWVLVALGTMNTPLGWILVVVLSANTLFSVYYYMRVVVQMSLRDDDRLPTVHAPIGGIAMVNICAFLMLAMFVFNAPLKRLTVRFSVHLYQAGAPLVRESAGARILSRTPYGGDPLVRESAPLVRESYLAPHTAVIQQNPSMASTSDQ